MKKNLLLLSLSLVFFAPVMGFTQEKKPNILFILTDDQAPHTLKAYGNRVCRTPNLDRLASEGITFTSAHHMGSWSGAVCTPSRTMIMTGRHVWRTRGLPTRNKKGSDHSPDKDLAALTPSDPAYFSMPAIFHRAGYDTFRTCKMGNSYEHANRLFQERRDKSCRGNGDKPDSLWHGEQVLTYLRKRQATQDKDPFLIYFGFSHPHDPRYGQPELLARYGATNGDLTTTVNPKSPPLQINYLPAHPFHHGHPNLRDEVRVQGVMTRRDAATIRNELGREYACIEQIDRQIGRVLKQLEAMGELDNTYIFFTSDHGIAVGRHGLTGKQNLYEHTWRVPLIVRGPGIKAGSRALGNTYLMDVLPTMCDLAGIPQSDMMDGLSFKSVLLGRQEQIRDVLYGVYCGGTKPGMRAVKKGDWKLIKYDTLDGKVRKTQLFNLRENPNELLKEHHDSAVAALTNNQPQKNQINLAGDPRYADKRAEMEALLLAQQKKMGDPYRLWDQPPVTTPKKPKGVILVMVDDIGYGDIHALSPSDLATPHIDKLHASSVRFTDFHVGTTCSPTRGALMSGRYINAGGVFHTVAGRSILREGEQTLVQVFQANGWRTGIFGKWHLGDGYPYLPRHRGFDVEVIHCGGGVGQQPDHWNNNYYADKDYDGQPTQADVYCENGHPVTSDAFCTDFWFKRAQQFMEKAVAANKPFFCYIPTNAAHGPFNAPHGGKKGFDGLIENVDYNMGRLDAFLKDKGLMDDVLLIFTTDNGTAGRKRMGGLRGKKGSHYEGGHNVPCFWRWPKGGLAGSKKMARDINSLTTIADLMPTFIDLFDLKKPAGGKKLHGVSLKSMLLDPEYKPVERSWVIDTQRQRDLVKWRRTTILKDKVKNNRIVNKWRVVRNSEQSPFEVYDILQDRAQVQDLAQKRPGVIKDLTSVYETWWQEISVGQKTYAPYVLGVEPETILFSHDWIGQDSAPWNQPSVKKAAKGSRTSAVRFDRAGTYSIELRRWPREDGGLITGKDASGQGKALSSATQARLSIKGVGVWTQPITPNAATVVFKVKVPAGEQTTLCSAFLDENSKVLSGAYYVYVSME